MKQRKILIVDDSRVILEKSAYLLQEAGYEVVTTNEAINVPAMLETEKPDLLLVDVYMPLISGDNLVDRILVDRVRGTGCKIVFFSAAYRDLIQLAEQYNESVVGIIPKTEDLSNLVGRVNFYLAESGKIAYDLR